MQEKSKLPSTKRRRNILKQEHAVVQKHFCSLWFLQHSKKTVNIKYGTEFIINLYSSLRLNHQENVIILNLMEIWKII